MSAEVDIPDEYTIDLTLAGGVTLDGLPTEFGIGIRQIPQINLGVTQIPKIQLGVDPIDLSLRLKEFPAIRAHLPANFKVGLALLGVELLAIRLCGEAQIITEDYVPGPCEICGGGDRQGGRVINLAAGDV
jgi:hypothetical protein